MAISIFNLGAVSANGVASADVLAVVDVSDTTQSPQGSTKKVAVASLFAMSATAVTVSTPVNFTQTWNDGAVTFTFLKVNVTSTASAAASLLMDLQVGGSSLFSVSKAGKVIAGDGTVSTVTGLAVQAAITTAVGSGTSSTASFAITQTAVTTGTACACESITYTTHTAGIVTQVATVLANVYVSGVGGTTSTAIGVGSGGSLTAGTITNYRAFSFAPPASGATIGTAVAYYAGAMTAGAVNWQLYFASSASSGGVTFRSTALATDATVGHLFIPTCAGAPTGVPATIPTGQVAFQYDSTNHKLYVYSGAWRSTSALT